MTAQPFTHAYLSSGSWCSAGLMLLNISCRLSLQFCTSQTAAAFTLSWECALLFLAVAAQDGKCSKAEGGPYQASRTCQASCCVHCKIHCSKQEQAKVTCTRATEKRRWRASDISDSKSPKGYHHSPNNGTKTSKGFQAQNNRNCSLKQLRSGLQP